MLCIYNLNYLYVIPLSFLPGVLFLFYLFYIKNKDHASLDMVIKMYFLGFLPGSVIASLIELVLQVVIMMVCLSDQISGIPKTNDPSMDYKLKKTTGYFVFIFLTSFVVAGGNTKSF